MIAIIGILLAIVLPVVSSMRDKTRKLQDVANLKRIADAHKTYLEKFSKTAYRSSLWEVLAGQNRAEKDACILNDPNVYISSGDKWGSKVIKETIAKWGGTRFDLNDPYEKGRVATDLAQPGYSSSVYLLSYCTISGLHLNLPQDTTPLAFTRGLMSNGLWNETYGLYGSSGGYVVYLDGHVTWFDGSKPAKFLKYDESGWTSDIREALPGDGSYFDGSAAILCGSYRLKGVIPQSGIYHYTDEDGNILFLYHFGTGDLL